MSSYIYNQNTTIIYLFFTMADILRPGSEYTVDIHAVSTGTLQDETNRFMQRVYSWMALALVIS